MLRSGLVSLVLWLHLGSTFLCLALIQYTRENGDPCFQSESASNQSICYAFTSSNVDWATSESACATENGAFVIVQEAATQDALAGALQTANIAEAWIGAQNVVGNWTWNGDPLQVLGTPTSWRGGSPAAYSPTELNGCGRIIPPEGYVWEAQACAFPTAFICETLATDPQCNDTNVDFSLHLLADSRCFLFRHEKLSWSDARAFCEDRSIVLAKVDTQAVQDLLVTSEPGKTEMIEGYWMGLTRSSWLWYNGDPLMLTFWEASQPSRVGACARIERFDSATYLWGNWNCTDSSLKALCAVETPEITTTVAMTTQSSETTAMETSTLAMEMTTALATTTIVMETTTTVMETTTTAAKETTAAVMETTAAAMETTTTAAMETTTTASMTTTTTAAMTTAAMTTAAKETTISAMEAASTTTTSQPSTATDSVTSLGVTTTPSANATTGDVSAPPNASLTTAEPGDTNGSATSGPIAGNVTPTVLRAVAITLGVVGFLLGTASVGVLIARYQRKKLMEKERLLRRSSRRRSRRSTTEPPEGRPATTLDSTTATSGRPHPAEDPIYSVPTRKTPISTSADVHARNMIRYTDETAKKSKKSRSPSPVSSQGSSKHERGVSSSVSTPWGSVRGVGPYLTGKPRPATLDFMPQDRFHRTMPADAWGMSSRWSNRLY